MSVKLGNQWECDNSDCQKKVFIPRDAKEPFPSDWLNVEANGGQRQIVACGPQCLAKILAIGG